ncbi:probable phospholipid hydroperoxide glutathione peroxidase isoform X2 [Phragmites australis]|uniref:probable phospholipid hydroperoxide glutathione peroxidase isoform X2 n=1 Tax=Phragmites australis TaxID=29695 RepID=UPI002D77EA6F|nr:probable phospholipid hydroperoxide glutathione peroxidase isoform X2 [Phragmites australis]XP_062184576.1 probable phospholipid hydroperoxide glutathione peroxidase isoform X2 [Phragmites australis]
MGAAESSSKLAGSIHDFVVKDARGNDVELSRYKGKVVLIVNVASRRGLTNSNYTELGLLHEKYGDKGLEILAFPCTNLVDKSQVAMSRLRSLLAPASKQDTLFLARLNGNAAPLYKFLKSQKGGLFGERIKWNFTKFLVGKDGHVVSRYASTSSPLSIENNIQKLLEA